MKRAAGYGGPSLNSDISTKFPEEEILTGGDSIIHFVKINSVVFVYSAKTPQINPHEVVEVGQTTLISNSASPIILGSNTSYWNCMLTVTSGVVSILNANDAILPNAWFKGGCILI